MNSVVRNARCKRYSRSSKAVTMTADVTSLFTGEKRKVGQALSTKPSTFSTLAEQMLERGSGEEEATDRGKQRALWERLVPLF